MCNKNLEGIIIRLYPHVILTDWYLEAGDNPKPFAEVFLQPCHLQYVI